MKIETSDTHGAVPISESSLQAVVEAIANIVDMACEHEPDLGLMRLVNFIDLYRTYLAHEVDDFPGDFQPAAVMTKNPGRRMRDFVTFEQFIGDPHLLELAAQAASQDTGVVVTPPVPLKISANSAPSEFALA